MKKEYYLNKKQAERLTKRFDEFKDTIFKIYKAYDVEEITIHMLITLENNCRDSMKGYLVCMNDMGLMCKDCVNRITLLLDNYISDVVNHFGLDWIKELKE